MWNLTKLDFSIYDFSMNVYTFSKFPSVYEIKKRVHVVPHQRPRRQQSPMWPAVDLCKKWEKVHGPRWAKKKFMDPDEWKKVHGPRWEVGKSLRTHSVIHLFFAIYKMFWKFYLLCANLTHNKCPTKAVCRLEFVVCRLPWAAHDKDFAVGILAFVVCPWHTANNPIPVVSLLAKSAKLLIWQRN